METLEHGVYYGFGKHSFSAKMIRGLFVPVIILLASAIALVAAGSNYNETLRQVGNIGIGIAIGFGVIQTVIAYLEHLGTKFMISANALYIRTGILNRREISVPFRHINNLHQYQSVTDRMLSVAMCSIEVLDDEVTTTSRDEFSGDIHMKDLDIALLAPLREAILSHANTQRMYMVNDREMNGMSASDMQLEQKSRMYDQYVNSDNDSAYKPYRSE
jgi:uncharacterized membrane protein YdbT with pleckstrin-like domain